MNRVGGHLQRCASDIPNNVESKVDGYATRKSRHVRQLGLDGTG